MMKGRNLVILLGIPTWLFLIWKGDIYYTLFILICMVLALGEFYTLMEKKGNKPLRWMGMASTVFIADYYYVQPAITPHEMLGGMILIIILDQKFLMQKLHPDASMMIIAFQRLLIDLGNLE